MPVCRSDAESAFGSACVTLSTEKTGSPEDVRLTGTAVLHRELVPAKGCRSSSGESIGHQFHVLSGAEVAITHDKSVGRCSGVHAKARLSFTSVRFIARANCRKRVTMIHSNAFFFG